LALQQDLGERGGLDQNPQYLVFVATEGETILGVAAMTNTGKIP
jgi:hypothetical protein